MVPAVVVDQADFRGEDVQPQPNDAGGHSGRNPGSRRRQRPVRPVQVAFTESDAASLAVDQGVGELVVIVPAEVDAIVNADVGVGEMKTLTAVSGGFGQERRIIDNRHGRPRRRGARIDLDLGSEDRGAP